MTYNIITDQIGDVVKAMRVAAGQDPIEGAPYYMYGHRLEINNRLALMNANPSKAKKKYPLIALKLDIPAVVEGDMLKYDLNIAILAYTDKTYTAEQRMDNVFKPVLFPLYDSFMEKLKRSGHFTWDKMLVSRPPHTKVDRFYYGTLSAEQSVKNVFSDPLDAVELVNLKINSRIKTC